MAFATVAQGVTAAIDSLSDTVNPTAPALEEIVVVGRYIVGEEIDTATGLGLTIFETPQSVSVMTQFRIKDQNLRSLNDVVRNATGLSTKSFDSTRESFSARGFDIDNYQIDGIPIAWSGGGAAGETKSDTSLYERVEVVRGATGLLTGVGNPSASINLVRKHAESEELQGYATLSYGRWDSYRGTVDAASALSSSGDIRGRVVLNYERGGVFRERADVETWVGYATVSMDLTEQTQFRVGASYQDNEPTASGWDGLPVWYSDGSLIDWGRTKTSAANWSSWGSTVENYYAEIEHHFASQWRLKAAINHNINAADLDLLYLVGTINQETGRGLFSSPFRSDTEREQTSVSLHMNGSVFAFGQEHELTLGAIKSVEDNVAVVWDPPGFGVVGNFFEWDGDYPQPDWGESRPNVDLKTKQSGLYAAARLSVNDVFKVIVGGRLADWEQEGFQFDGFIDYGETDELIPYAGVTYEVTPNHNLYASYTRIFLPQQERDAQMQPLEAVVGDSREIGLKSSFADGLLHTVITYFNVLQDNLAQKDGDAYLLPTGELYQPYKQAEGATSKGFEVELSGQLSPGWDLILSYTAFEVEDADGNAVNTNHPKKMMKLYTNYHVQGAWEGLTLAGGVNWQSGNYTDTQNYATGQAERLRQSGYALANLMARYAVTPDLALQLNVENLFDKKYYSQIGFFSQATWGEPRNLKLSVTYEF